MLQDEPEASEVVAERLKQDGVDLRVNAAVQRVEKNIYAAGDCTGGYQFTHYAGYQGFMAVRNAFLPFN